MAIAKLDIDLISLHEVQAANPASVIERQSTIDDLLCTLAEGTIPQMLLFSGQLHAYAFQSKEHASTILSCEDMLAARKGLEVNCAIHLDASSDL